MSIVLQRLYSGGQIATTITTLVTGAANVKTLITEWSFCNVDASAHTLTVYLVRSGGSPGLANILLPPTTLQASETLPMPTGQVLYAGDTLQADVDANSVITCPNITGYTVPA